MSRAIVLLAAVTLLPAMTGPVSGSSEHEAMIALCAGGSVSIPLGPAPSPGEANSPCCAKGCHSSRSRKSVDRAQ